VRLSVAIVLLLGLAGTASGQTRVYPGEEVIVECVGGEWRDVATSATLVSASCTDPLPPPPPPAGDHVIGWEEVNLFDSIPQTYRDAAASLSVVMIDRSVGSNIEDGRVCLEGPYAQSRSVCRRYLHVDPAFNNYAETWTGTYPSPLWHFYMWPGAAPPSIPEVPCASGLSELACVDHYLASNPHDYVIVEPSYLLEFNADEYTNWIGQHPNAIMATSSLQRGAGDDLTQFNDAIRAYASDPNHIRWVFDVADILSHTQNGAPCYDNRDGVPYNAGNRSENYPNDGINTPAICQNFTREVDGGHLGNPDVGKIRAAKALWVLMARIAGW